jgi:hypothetical protein
MLFRFCVALLPLVALAGCRPALDPQSPPIATKPEPPILLIDMQCVVRARGNFQVVTHEGRILTIPLGRCVLITLVYTNRGDREIDLPDPVVTDDMGREVKLAGLGGVVPAFRLADRILKPGESRTDEQLAEGVVSYARAITVTVGPASVTVPRDQWK